MSVQWSRGQALTLDQGQFITMGPTPHLDMPISTTECFFQRTAAKLLPNRALKLIVTSSSDWGVAPLRDGFDKSLKKSLRGDHMFGRTVWLLGWALLLTGPLFAKAPVRIIYETDMESDIDDAGGLAMLHALADNGECILLAVMHNTSDPYGVGMINAVNTYYGRPTLPIGSYKQNDAPSAHFGGAVHYTESIAKDARFPKDVVTRDDVPDATAVYQRVLADQPNQSVVIVSVGWTTNLRNLLQMPYGPKLVRQKVQQLVLMGGGWEPSDVPHTATMNLAGNQVIPAAFESGKYIVDHWPTPIVFSGLSIGGKVLTGEGLKTTPDDNPVREAYRICKKHYGQKSWQHASWDQTAILFAVRGTQSLWSLNTHGTPHMFLKPNTEKRFLRWHTLWDSHTDSHHAYLRFASTPRQVANAIESLMIQPPIRKTK